jgi:NTE family protein
LLLDISLSFLITYVAYKCYFHVKRSRDKKLDENTSAQNNNENNQILTNQSSDVDRSKLEKILEKIIGNKYIHKLVILNQIKLLRRLLEYLSENFLFDESIFNLKNKDAKTPFEIAADKDNYEAMFLLNHYESNHKSNENHNYDSVDLDKFDSITEEIEATNEKIPISKQNCIKNLIFQGGGIKGLAYLGALEEAEKEKIFKLNEIEKIAGTSAGAITACLLSVGYKVEDFEINQELKNINFKDLLIDSKDLEEQEIIKLYQDIKNLVSFNGFLMNILLLILSNMTVISHSTTLAKIIKYLSENKGLFAGIKFRNWIDMRIFEKLRIKNATFKHLQNKIESQNKATTVNDLKYLFITGSNLQTGKCEIFSHLHTPNMIIADAVRISMSIPFLFYPHKMTILKDGEPIIDPNNQSFYVDGGIFNNYPIRVFDPISVKKSSETVHINKQTLGFRLVSKDLKNNYEKLFENRFDSGTNDTTEKKLSSIFKMIVKYFMSFEESVHSEKIKDQERTIYIDSVEISPINFDLSNEDKNKLIESGKQGVLDFLIAKKRKLKNYMTLTHRHGNRLLRIRTLIKADSLILLNDGTLASASRVGTIKMWDISTGEEIKTLKGHTDGVTSLILLNDGILASASYDKTIKLWDISTGKEIKTLKGHTDGVISLILLNDGILASASYDNTIKLWY